MLNRNLITTESIYFPALISISICQRNFTRQTPQLQHKEEQKLQKPMKQTLPILFLHTTNEKQSKKANLHADLKNRVQPINWAKLKLQISICSFHTPPDIKKKKDEVHFIYGVE